MADHYTLDIDPDSLQSAKRWIGSLSNHLHTKGATIAGTPAEIGDQWTGEAATSITGEMSGLGALMKSPLATDLDAVATAIGTLEGHYRTAVDETLPDLNRRWREADQAYTDAVSAADASYDSGTRTEPGQPPMNRAIRDEFQTIRSNAVSAASTARDSTRAQIDEDYEALKTLLQGKTRDLGTALVEHTPVDVPPSALQDFKSHGTYPAGPLDMSALLGDLDVTQQYVQAEADHDAGAAAAEKLEPLPTPEEARALLASLDIDSAAFRQGFLESLDPQELANLHSLAAQQGVQGRDEYGALITGIATILAKGSNPELQAPYEVDTEVYDELVTAYTTETPGHTTAEGHLLLAELVAAGQGNGATWDSGLLKTFADKALAYEQEQRRTDEYWDWMEFPSNLVLPTEYGQGRYGEEFAGRADAIEIYMEALAEDSDAALAFLSDGDGANTDRLHYLYERPGDVSGRMSLGDLLRSATTKVGAGGPGSPEYASAEIVGDLVHYFATADDAANSVTGLEDAFTDILTTHVQAVNHAGTYDVDSLAITPNDNPDLPYQAIALANLSHEDLQTFLQLTFGMDYWSNDVAQDKDENAHDFPRFTQLSLAMEIAFRNDVQTLAKNGDAGQLEVAVNQLSHNQELVMNAFVDALVGTGAERDQANEDARAALQFVTGLVKDKVPVDKLGPLGEAGSLGLDKIDDLLVDTLIPETDYEGAAAEDASTEDYRRRLTSLKLVSWLDEAGALPQEHSPEAWAAANPNTSSFVNPDGSIPSLDDLYQHRNDSDLTKQQWTDFLRYYQSEGGAWLAEIDVAEQYQLGWLTQEGGG